jgi:hypothetical protein
VAEQRRPTPNYLDERFAEWLCGQDVQFEFLMQLQTDAKRYSRFPTMI